MRYTCTLITLHYPDPRFRGGTEGREGREGQTMGRERRERGGRKREEEGEREGISLVGDSQHFNRGCALALGT